MREQSYCTSPSLSNRIRYPVYTNCSEHVHVHCMYTCIVCILMYTYMYVHVTEEQVHVFECCVGWLLVSILLYSVCVCLLCSGAGEGVCEECEGGADSSLHLLSLLLQHRTGSLSGQDTSLRGFCEPQSHSPSACGNESLLPVVVLGV